ncbi:hypothetical protein DB30_03527 [Enhygromyxa salina]|uniref:Large ribosomal subunit protein bL12 C-terminal domain-containing protein n=1 Tax=Enhygromyxa salina TaxID=215803 RepID=A0A0C1ZI54_9BACT|nr:ribosomal protein L7/L12 [Enhygromyxa salina]KIG17214.1 hypothetical protein DB30_03527 [Enhygromyxa salina]
MARHRTRVLSFGPSKILAIKLVRELSGAGLREAKELVETGSEFEFELNPRTQTTLRDAARHGVRFELGSAQPGDAEATSGSVQSFAVRFVASRQKIHAIKLILELTRLGLAEAKGIADRGDVIARDLDQAAAAAIVAQFAQIRTEVEIIGGTATPRPTEPEHEHDLEPFYDDDDDF